MRKTFTAVVLSALALAGCATVPTLTRSDKAATRAQLATYFIDQLQLDRKLDVRLVLGDTSFKPAPTVLTKPPRKPEIPDYGKLNKRERLDVKKVVELGIMDLYPDGTFRPYDFMTRAEFAQTLQRILIYSLGDKNLASRFVGSESPFSDVANSHYAFNAVMVVTTRGLMKGTTKGTFNPMGNVTGQEALDAIDRIKPLL